ncbi:MULTISPECIES: type IV toxin-antitoxin system AbiEi family antitoxin domain-containing protein [Arthrobacter]|uniref:Type IV toxin-antitoxin system AbiEi family antitoxin domain-containing protein n=2 Tax=Arthrobacter TaxID=1663 RepID=A0ABU9KMR1_9MICC|nr:type IV toxin-antitoxin system AbiEi family antitoxin domain-containing protein [Arthrobacter sp. YJM1]MDP5227461.1 type IV toxin-antitoxin system AbiEi family antitoxin domain-containing protein [Arthrobacter sp. YJM1]
MDESCFHLIRVGDARDRGIDAYELSRRHRAGSLHRLRRGVYVETARWEALSPAQHQHVLLQVAVEAYGSRFPLWGPSSAFLLGLPLRNTPEFDGIAPAHLLNPVATGGRSTSGIIHHRPDGRERRIIGVKGLPCGDVVNTAVDVASGESFDWAVAAMDRVLNPRKLSGERFTGPWDSERRIQLSPTRPAAVQQGWALPDGVDPPTEFGAALATPSPGTSCDTTPPPSVRSRERIAAAISQLRNTAVQRRMHAALAFADPGAFLPGESLSRVLMHRFDLPQPELQTRFTDRHGLIGYTDFHWKQWRMVGEFDGKEKYLKPEYLNGRTPSEVVIAEKAREDRLRRLGLTVVRWIWRDLDHPDRLISLLQSAGLPRSTRHHWVLSR